MGAFKKWLKSVMGLKTSDSNVEENVKGTDRRNRNLWKSPSVDRSSVGCFGRRKEAVDTGASDSSVSGDGDVFSAAVATIIRVPPKDFMVIRREWASVRIQTAFRAFLARRAFRALKAVVRLQALVRGRQVRKQAAVTLQCMQALVRVQAQVRARNQANLVKQAEERWCNSSGSMRQVRKKLQMRRGEAPTRERAIPYSLSQEKLRSSPSSSPMHNKSVASLKHRKKYVNNLVEELHTYPSDTYSSSKKGEGHTSGYNHANVRSNNLTKRNSIKKPLPTQQVKSSASDPSSEFPPECSSSTSSNSSMKESDGSTTSNPSYMNPTKSIKAKQRENMMRHVMEDFPYMNSVAPSVGNTRRSTGFHQSNWIDMRG